MSDMQLEDYLGYLTPTVRNRVGYYNVFWGGNPPDHRHRIGMLSSEEKDHLLGLLHEAKLLAQQGGFKPTKEKDDE